MTNNEILAKVKTGLMITGSNFDDVLILHIQSVKSFMEFAGVKKSVVDDEVSLGCILTGVNDLWNNGAGEVKFSEFFRWRVAQLCDCEGKAVANATYTVCVPSAETISSFGWFVTTLTSQFAKNLNSCEFTVTDDEIVKVVAQNPYGEVTTGENSQTGNRRNITVGNSRVGVYPDTIYDITQNKFVDNAGTTCIVAPVDFAGYTLTFETFDKGAE